MTKRNANKLIKLTFEHIHSLDDVAKAVTIIERLSQYTEVKPEVKPEVCEEDNIPEGYILADGREMIRDDELQTKEEEDEEDNTLEMNGGLFEEPEPAPVVRRVIPTPAVQSELHAAREIEIGSFMPPLPERTEAEKVKAEPPAAREAPIDDKLKKLMEQAPTLMSEPAWKTFEAMYRRGQTYEELCNTWDYFHKTQPADWQERPQ